MIKSLENEAFYSQILTLDVDGKSEEVILKDVQRHPAKPIVLHMDFLRVSKNTQLTTRAPIHFINEDVCVGVKIGGGILLQTPDHINFDINDCKIVSNLKPTPDQLTDMSFAWHVAKYVKSNAIIFCKDKMTLGVGAGQMSRVDSAKIASQKNSEMESGRI